MSKHWGLSPNNIMSASKVNNYITDATDVGAGNLKFDSTTEATFTVPAGKRWFLIAGSMNRDANTWAVVDFYDSADKNIMRLAECSPATGRTGYPNNSAVNAMEGHKAIPMILDAGEYIKLTFGAAQGAGANASCLVLEIPI